MNEYRKKNIILVIKILFLAIFLAMIIIGQKTTGLASLGLMLLGLAGILVLLYLYNKPHKETPTDEK